jgi:hypothetical protein
MSAGFRATVSIPVWCIFVLAAAQGLLETWHGYKEAVWEQKVYFAKKSICNCTSNPAAAYPYAQSSAAQALIRSAHGTSPGDSMPAAELIQRTWHTMQQQFEGGLGAVKAAASSIAQLTAEQRHQVMAILDKAGPFLAVLSAELAQAAAPVAQMHGPLQEDEYPASPQQRPQQQQATADQWQYIRLAVSSYSPSLWDEMVKGRMSQQPALAMQTYADMQGVCPAAVATVVDRLNAAGALVRYTQILIPHQQAQQQAEPLQIPALPAVPPANTTCSLQEAPATPLPLPLVQPEETACPAMSLRALINCTTTTTAAPAAVAACRAQAAMSSGPSCDCASCGCFTEEDVEDLINEPADSVWQALWKVARTTAQAVKNGVVSGENWLEPNIKAY